MTRTSDARERPIAADERSGVLYPERLVRYQAGWIDPDPASSAVVDQYWHVAWALAVLSDLTPAQVADTAVPLTADLDPRLHGFMQRIADCTAPPPNDVLDELRERIHHRTGTTLTERFARSERTIQRACLDTLGHGPKWLSRRIRLQEVALALALATRPTEELAVIAADLGYTDQSHLTRDFRTATGVTPDAYRRTIRSLTA